MANKSYGKFKLHVENELRREKKLKYRAIKAQWRKRLKTAKCVALHEFVGIKP